MAGATGALTGAVRDLRRRKVFRTAAAYGVAAWLTIEISSVVMPALLLPEWSVRLVVIVAIAGFPIAMVLAWAFDITQDGVVRTPGVSDTDAPSTAPGGRVVDFIIIGVLLAALVFLLIRPDPVVGAGGETRSIAVLPFADLSQERDSAYFADGVSEELLNNLVAIPGLRVAARTSSFAFRGKNEDVRQIGQRLNVDTVLEGSVRRAGDAVKITAQLIDVNDGFQLWSATYDRRMLDIFSVQEEISRAIVDALKMELLDAGERKLQRADTDNIEAYDLYLLGRHHWHQRTPESLTRAIALFEQAIKIDPEYALAYTGLADSYLLLSGYGDLPTAEATRKAEPLVARALSLQPDLAEAYASQGLLRWQRGDLAAGELALRGAIELNRNLAMAHMWLGGVLSEQGRLRDAFAAYRRAWELDRLHPVINTNMATTLVGMGRFDEAETYLLTIEEVDPASDKASMLRVDIALRAGRYDEAVGAGIEALRKTPTDDKTASMVATAYANLGEFEIARQWLERLEGSDNEHVQQARNFALLLAGEEKAVVELADRELIALGNWRSASLARESLMRLVWPGIVRTIVGDYPLAVELLERVVAHEGMNGNPADRVGIMMLLAHGHAKLGNTQRARELLDDCLLAAGQARLNGWRDPRLEARVAGIHALRNDIPKALELLRAAVDAGWREYWFSLRLPLDEALRDNAEYRQIMESVLVDLEAMRIAAGSIGPAATAGVR